MIPPGGYEYPRVSPDGTRVAFATAGADQNVSIYDLGTKAAPRRLTFSGRNRFPVWSSDGRRIVFQSDREGDRGIFWQGADDGTAERLTTAEQIHLTSLRPLHRTATSCCSQLPRPGKAQPVESLDCESNDLGVCRNRIPRRSADCCRVLARRAMDHLLRTVCGAAV